MQGYIMSLTSNLFSHVAMKYDGCIMAHKSRKQSCGISTMKYQLLIKAGTIVWLQYNVTHTRIYN